jgi:hypothetical protein
MMHNYCVDSKEWYESSEQAQAYLDLFATSYASGIVTGENALLEEVVEGLAQKCSPNVRFIGLGPGNGQKADFVTSKLHESVGISHYKCVDIQPMYLDIAEKIVGLKGIPTSRFAGSFEDYLDVHASTGNEFVYLGATFCNFGDAFDVRLRDVLTSNDLVYVSSERFPSDIGSMLEGYRKAKSLALPLAEKYGLDPNSFHVEFNEDLHQVELGFKNEEAFTVVLVSKKPTEEEFKKRVTKNFKGDFYMNDCYIGFVGSPKK